MLEKGARRTLAGEEGLSSDKLYAAPPPEFLLTPLLMGPVCLLNQDRFEEPVRPCGEGTAEKWK